MEVYKQPFNERKSASETSELYAMECYKNRKDINIIRSGLDALDIGILIIGIWIGVFIGILIVGLLNKENKE